MTLLPTKQFEEKFEVFKQNHPELTQKQLEMVEDFLSACNRFGKIFSSDSHFRRYNLNKSDYCGDANFSDADQHLWLAIDFFGGSLSFEKVRADPRHKKWESADEIEKSVADWINRRSKENGEPQFPTNHILRVSDELPNAIKIREVTGIPPTELYEKLYEAGAIPFEYKPKLNQVRLRPKDPNMHEHITGNEQYWSEKSRRTGHAYNKAR